MRLMGLKPKENRFDFTGGQVVEIQAFPDSMHTTFHPASAICAGYKSGRVLTIPFAPILLMFSHFVLRQQLRPGLSWSRAITSLSIFTFFAARMF